MKTRRRRARTSRPTRPGLPARLDRWPLLRMQAVAVICLLLLAGLGLRAWALQIDRNDYYKHAAERQHLATMEVPAPRGVILDAVGRELAVTADAASIWANPRKVKDVTATAEKLAELTGVDVRVLEDKLSCGRQFIWIRRHVKEELTRAIEKAELAGVHITYEPRRYYP
ncbi:MAG: hypothetical protein KJO07_13185, partial [Deltaproteobacteria bacterium]|nr:hypothetical protein [Deltaproteobacteria bacterium]